MSTITIQNYKSKSELTRAHPTVRSFKTILIIPRGQGDGAILEALHKKNISGLVYRVGNLILQVESTVQPATIKQQAFAMANSVTKIAYPECCCFTYAGDNPACQIHRRN